MENHIGAKYIDEVGNLYSFIPEGKNIRELTAEEVALTLTSTWSIKDGVVIEDVSKKILEIREKRKVLLNEHIDTVNAVRWNTLTEEERVVVSEYRQSLLDITNQIGYPDTVEWPEIPEVLK